MRRPKCWLSIKPCRRMVLSEDVITGAEGLTLSGQAMGNSSMYLPATSVSASSGHGRNQSVVHLKQSACEPFAVR